MTTTGYMAGRQKWYRPQAMLWSEDQGTLVDGKYIPLGVETLSDLSGVQPANRFLILSDHNRAPIDIYPERIEQKRRMVNGTLRSYHIADKLKISTSWSLLPSRSFSFRPDFNQSTGLPDTTSTIANPNPPPAFYPVEEYTADGGAGGVEMLSWYQSHTGPFWVFLAYDKYINFGVTDTAYTNLPNYNQIVQMQISSFDYSIIKRSGANASFNGYDMWNVSVTLEEV